MIEQYEESLLDLIDARIENANDDELFAGGYLRGHISLSAAKCEEAGVDSLDVFESAIEESLNAARSELTPADREIVAALWHDLKAAISA